MFSALLLCQESKGLLLFLMAFDFSSSTRNCRSGGCKLPNTSLAVFPLKLPSSTSKGLLPSPVGHSVSPSSQYLSRLLQSSPFLHLSPCIFVFPWAFHPRPIYACPTAREAFSTICCNCTPVVASTGTSPGKPATDKAKGNGGMKAAEQG